MDNDKEQNYCILLKRCEKQENEMKLRGCQVLLERLPPSENVPTNPAIPRVTSESIPSGQEKGLKRTLSQDSVTSQDSSHNSAKLPSTCDGCGKSFTLLFSHLSRNASCSKKYDMQKTREIIGEIAHCAVGVGELFGGLYRTPVGSPF